MIDYLLHKNKLLQQKLDGPRIQFTNAERRRLAIRAKALNRKVLSQLDTLETVVRRNSILAQGLTEEEGARKIAA